MIFIYLALWVYKTLSAHLISCVQSIKQAVFSPFHRQSNLRLEELREQTQQVSCKFQILNQVFKNFSKASVLCFYYSCLTHGLSVLCLEAKHDDFFFIYKGFVINYSTPMRKSTYTPDLLLDVMGKNF